MAKKRAANTRDSVPNEYRLDHTMGADTSVIADNCSLINTGMVIGQGQKTRMWWLLGAYVQPVLPADIPLASASAGRCKFQLAIGDHTGDAAFLDHDDAQRITSMAVYLHYSTNGGQGMIWPVSFPLPYPKPILAKHITFHMATSVDEANWDSQTFGLTLIYLTRDIDGAAIGEYLAAYGDV